VVIGLNRFQHLQQLRDWTRRRFDFSSQYLPNLDAVNTVRLCIRTLIFGQSQAFELRSFDPVAFALHIRPDGRCRLIDLRVIDAAADRPTGRCRCNITKRALGSLERLDCLLFVEDADTIKYVTGIGVWCNFIASRDEYSSWWRPRPIRLPNNNDASVDRNSSFKIVNTATAFACLSTCILSAKA
jgi:hypothetical protein